MIKTIVLQTFPLTKRKQKALAAVRMEANRVLQKYIIPKLDNVTDNSQLQKKVYHKIKKDTFLQSQVILNLIRCSMALKDKPTDKREVNSITLDFNLPRSGKLFEKNKVLYARPSLGNKKFISIPIQNNGSLERLRTHEKDGWKIKQFSISAKGKILVAIEKRKVRKEAKNFLGIDVNANNVAVSIIDQSGKVLKQTYLGKGIWRHKAKILKRKSKLQSLARKGSSRAKTSLKKLKRKLSNFTKNNTGELAKEIHKMAEDNNAKIVMEDLKRFNPEFSKESNRKISLIPFALLNQRIISRSINNGIPLSYVNPYHTSKWCTRCGSVNPGHKSGNYALYRCSKCGLECNSDRKASHAIAIKKLVEREYHANPKFVFQTSTSEAPVNALFRRDEGDANNG